MKSLYYISCTGGIYLTVPQRGAEPLLFKVTGLSGLDTENSCTFLTKQIHG
jgi:hypothetical protein